MVLLCLAAVVVALILRAHYLITHPVACCRRCGVRLGRYRRPRMSGLTCTVCGLRERRDADAQQQMRAARRRADRAYAAAESARIDGRFPVRRAGTFGRVGGAFVLDGWVFEDPRAIADAGARTATLPQQLTLGRRDVVYGWRLDELHAEAHGTFCTCLA